MPGMDHTPEDQAVAKIRRTVDSFCKTATKRSQPISSGLCPESGSKDTDGTQQFDLDLMSRVHIIEASSSGSVIVEIEVGMQYANSAGILHGGAAALILDQFTTAAFIPMDSYNMESAGSMPPGGVTRSLNVTYLRPLQLPATIRVESRVLQMGEMASLAVGSITRAGSPKRYCIGEHHKLRAAAGGRMSSKDQEAGAKL